MAYWPRFSPQEVQKFAIIINIQGQITNCPHKNARLAGENEFLRAANHIALALLLIGSSDPEAFLKLVASFAPSLRSGANDATRVANKQYALQKSCYCPIIKYGGRR